VLSFPYFPAGHGLQDVWPFSSWYVPFEHSCPSLYLPLAVGVHLSLESKPGVSLDVPAGQALHPLSDEMPLASLYLPMEQLVQLFASKVYSSLLSLPYLPAEHGLHEV
jgi:hypothetical protein